MRGFNGQTLTYDLNGNLTGDGTNTYTWDARNHLSAISGAVTAGFVYDALGRRTKKTIAGATTQFFYDGLNPVQELDGATPANVTANLLAGLNIDERFTRTDSNGTLNFLTETLGSTVALADATGAIATSYTYEPFGKTTTGGTSSANSYQFTGRENDGTGLYFNRARYYGATYQSFISQDPLDFRGGDPNLYGYVINNPMSYADPFGLFSELCTRNMKWPLWPIPGSHCYIRFNGDKGDTLSFDTAGVHPDPGANSHLDNKCESAGNDDQDPCIRKEMKKCESSQYSFFSFNCCHCAEQAMKACGANIPPGDWPNWPINPGPQPGESGYKP
jgi:RHS repeat-associated protein